MLRVYGGEIRKRGMGDGDGNGDTAWIEDLYIQLGEYLGMPTKMLKAESIYLKRVPFKTKWKHWARWRRTIISFKFMPVVTHTECQIRK